MGEFDSASRGNYFTAGHSLFSFHVEYEDFLRSLYYNMLLMRPVRGFICLTGFSLSDSF